MEYYQNFKKQGSRQKVPGKEKRLITNGDLQKLKQIKERCKCKLSQKGNTKLKWDGDIMKIVKKIGIFLGGKRKYLLNLFQYARAYKEKEVMDLLLDVNVIFIK